MSTIFVRGAIATLAGSSILVSAYKVPVVEYGAISLTLSSISSRAMFAVVVVTACSGVAFTFMGSLRRSDERWWLGGVLGCIAGTVYLVATIVSRRIGTNPVEVFDDLAPAVIPDAPASGLLPPLLVLGWSLLILARQRLQDRVS